MQNINKLYSPVGRFQSQSSASGSPLASASAVQFTGQFSTALHQQHRSLELAQVLAMVRQHVGRQWWSTEVVGSWVWVYQSRSLSQAERSTLFELGFHWNPRRQVWQHPCGVLTPPAAVGPLARYIPAHQAHPRSGGLGPFARVQASAPGKRIFGMILGVQRA